MKDKIHVALTQLHDDNVYMFVYIGNQLTHWVTNKYKLYFEHLLTYQILSTKYII